MSIQVMTLVWKRFPASGSELLAMLALADWCNDEGGSLHPSMRKVAEKIRVSEKQARRILHSFEDDGYLEVVGNQFGGAPGTTKQYRLNVEKIESLPLISAKTTPSGVTPPMDVTPPTGVHDASHGCPETPPMGGSQYVNEPSDKHQKKKEEKAPPISFTGFGFENLTDDLIEFWVSTYPAVSVFGEISKAAAWLNANPKNKKSDYKRFLNNWLARAQDRAPRVGQSTVQMPRSKSAKANATDDYHAQMAEIRTRIYGTPNPDGGQANVERDITGECTVIR